MAERDFLIAALSGRSLAAAAARAGHGVFVLDLFNDSDLAPLAVKCVRVEADGGGGFDRDSLLGAAWNLACGDNISLVFGAGFEDRPELLERLAETRPLCGNSPQTLARIKDPGDFFAALDRLGIPHPEISLASPDDPPEGPPHDPPNDPLENQGDWLVKPVGGSGGRHILLLRSLRSLRSLRPVGGNGPPDIPVYDRPVYYQRALAGRAVSLLFLGDGARICVLGLSEQYPSPFPPQHPCRFGFAVTLPDGDPALPALKTALTATATALTEIYALVGLNSLDALVDDVGGLYILEVNPRPGVTLDIFDHLAGAHLFDLHVAAVAGTLPEASEVMRARADIARACGILYADAPLQIGEGVAWPAWTADRPQEGTRLAAGDPVCTVFAEGDTPSRAIEDVRSRAESFSGVLSGVLSGALSGV